MEFLRKILIRSLRWELERKEKIERDFREALASTFETMPGDRRFCIRRQEVVDHVVKTLGIEVLNNATYYDVRSAATSLGWEAIKNGNRSLFRCVKRRALAAESALAVSRKHRRDPRVKVGKGGNVPRSVATITNLSVACTP